MNSHQFSNMSRDSLIELRPHITLLFTVVLSIYPPMVTGLLGSMAGLGFSTHEPTGDYHTDITSFAALLSAVPGLEWKGVARNVLDFLTTHIPHHVLLGFIEGIDPLNIMALATLSSQRGVAWLLDSSPEVVLEQYQRIVVPSREIRADRPLRAIVKIIVFFGNGVVNTGSGVLVDAFTVVTAGHVLFNENVPAKAVQIWAGLGDGSNTPQSRKGVCVAVHYKWYSEHWRPNDLAFVRLSASFNTVQPIGYMQTPVADNNIIGSIYGFPSDMPDGEQGNRLCVSSSPVRYKPSYFTGLLEHVADSYSGTSGGAVLNKDGILIAIHRGWALRAGGGLVNQAVVINHGGNDFQAFYQILKYMTIRNSNGVRQLWPAGDVGGFVFEWPANTALS